MTQTAGDWRSRVRFVLVATQHSGNVGSAARALKTMQFSELVLVSPSRLPDDVAHAMAAGADDVLSGAVVVDSLEQAVADCQWVIGTTARSRRVGLEELTPPQAAKQVHRKLGLSDRPVAVVFGRERTGLTNDELQLCNAGLTIPANPDYSSLNLAAAVQVISYELNRDALDNQTANMTNAIIPATHRQWEGFFEQAAEILRSIDFHKGRSEKSALFKLRRAFLRAPMEEKEVRMLRGVLHDMQRALRLRSPDD